MSWLNAIVLTVVVGSFTVVPAAAEEPPAPEAGCSFRTNPSDFLNAQARVRREVFESTRKLQRLQVAAAASSPLPARNFVDEAIFAKIAAASIAAAPRSSDEEFVRRIYLDLTGRIPGAEDVRTFLADERPSKRDDLIDKLLYSAEFTDKWTVWFGDLVQNVERLATNARAPQIEGRNALHGYLRESVANQKPVRTMVQELIAGRGNNYYHENGPANYAVLASTAMGPAQDTYDMMLVRTAGAFLGMSNYDCLLCHNGRGHLDGINLWGQRSTRVDAQRMAAHFSRMRLNNGAPGSVQYEHILYNSTDVVDAVSGQYDLNTSVGNRPNRTPVGSERNLTPEYRDGTKAALNANWRVAFGDKLVEDPMFGRNFANRLWKQFFGMGLVDPVDTLDPDRLDAKAPPPAPWTLQATHPELLERLAEYFVANNTDLRTFIRLLVESNAYQLSSQYLGEWKFEYVPLFARHYPRRLEGEEVHDAITKATGVPGRYTWPMVNGQTIPRGTAATQSEPVAWAMQLPDPSEPRNNGSVREFMRGFYRGNRDTAQRLQAGSIPQQLSLMNDAFVTNRTKVSASPALREIAAITEDSRLIEELFLRFLSRKPTLREMEKATAHLAKGNTQQRRNAAVEDLAWACINKVDFLFSY